MSYEYHTTRRIEFSHTDMAGIVHFATFFNFMEEVEHEFLRSLGVSVVMDTDDGTIGWPRVRTDCQFKQPARFEDVLDVHLVVIRKSTRSVTYRITFSRDGQEVACGETVAVCCRLPGDQTVESIPIPATIGDKIEQAPEDHWRT